MNLDQRPQVEDTKNELSTFPIAIKVGPNPTVVELLADLSPDTPWGDRQIAANSTKSNFILPKERKMNTKTLSIILLSSLTLVSVVFLAACAPMGGASVVLAQPEFIKDDISRSWEIDADDIAAAREAALSLSQTYTAARADLEGEDVLRSWEIDADDIAAAHEAALSLSQTHTAAGVDLEGEAVLRSWEIDADDIAAASEAALSLSQAYTAARVDLEGEAVLRSWEIDADDIAAAREAALYLAATL